MGKIGKPLKFKTVKDLQDKIDAYFEWAEKEKKPLTLERLADFLDCELDTVRNYENRSDEYFGAVKKARRKVLASKVERLNDKKEFTPGIIFDLTNNHSNMFSNKQHIDQHNTNDNYNSTQTPEERDAEIKRLEEEIKAM